MAESLASLVERRLREIYIYPDRFVRCPYCQAVTKDEQHTEFCIAWNVRVLLAELDRLREAVSLSSPEGTRGDLSLRHGMTLGDLVKLETPTFMASQWASENSGGWGVHVQHRVEGGMAGGIIAHAKDKSGAEKLALELARAVGQLKALSSPSSTPAATPQVLRCSLPMGHGGDHFYSIKVSAAGSLTGLTCAAYALDSEASPRVSAATPAPDSCINCHLPTRFNPDDQWVLDEEGAEAVGPFCGPCMTLIRGVSAAERPAPTCATCKHDTDYAECKANWRRPIVGVYWKQNNGCTLHEPAPPGPVAQEKDK